MESLAGSTLGEVVNVLSTLSEFKKASPPIDNVAWVKQYAADLDPNDPDKTFRFVTRGGKHPFFGCFWNQLDGKYMDQIARMSNESIAFCADAVTVCCYEMLGARGDVCLADAILATKEGIDHAMLGNVAFIAVHHSDPKIREELLQILEELKKKFLVD